MVCRTIVLIALLAAACEQTSTHFTPYAAQYTNGMRKVVSYTIVCYEGDIPSLVAAGGEIIGTLDVNGTGLADANMCAHEPKTPPQTGAALMC
jgi:hypothetical protein